MINRTNRFHGRASIQRLYKTGKVVRSGSLNLRYGVHPKRQTYRLGVVVSRKVSKSAVVRNRIRRRLYERVRILSSSFTAPYDLLLVVYHAELADIPAEQLDREVVKILRKAKIIQSPASNHVISDDTRPTV